MRFSCSRTVAAEPSISICSVTNGKSCDRSSLVASWAASLECVDSDIADRLHAPDCAAAVNITTGDNPVARVAGYSNHAEQLLTDR